MYEYYENENKVEQNQVNKTGGKEKKHRFGMVIVYALVFGLIAGGTIQGVSLAGDVLRSRMGLSKEQIAEKDSEADDEQKHLTKDNKKEDAAEKEDKSETSQSMPELNKKDPVATQLKTTGSLDVSAVAANAMPSIVSITNKSVQEVRSFFSSAIRQYESVSAGSGIIVSDDDDELLIVTNNHVVEGAETLSVSFIDDEVCEAVIKGTDPENDLAVISVKKSDIKDSTMDKISVATMGDSDSLVIGEQVVAIGNALGYGQSVTTGIVSALEREVEIDNLASKLIQTDAAINPGNSGGALLNMDGDVIGINSAKFASSEIEGMGYAIPISTATPIIEELMNRQTRELVDEKDASYLGISGVAVTNEVSKTYNIPTGIYVSEADEKGPAGKAGITKGDVIRKFDGISVSSINDIKEQLKYYKAGEVVKLTIMRSDGSEYKEEVVDVTLGKRSESDIKDEDQQETEPETEEDNYNGGMYIDPFSIFGY